MQKIKERISLLASWFDRHTIFEKRDGAWLYDFVRPDALAKAVQVVILFNSGEDCSISYHFNCWLSS